MPWSKKTRCCAQASAEQDRYKRRWGLRLNRLPETDGENIRGIVLVIIGKFVPYHSATLNIAVICCTQSRRREKGEEQTDRSSLCLRWAVEERERRGLESCEAGANLQGESHSLCRRIEQARQGCRCEAVATSRRGKTQVVKAFFRQGVAVVDRWRNVTDWFTLYELKPYTFSTGEFIHAVVYLNTAYRWYCRGR